MNYILIIVLVERKIAPKMGAIELGLRRSIKQ